jgi:hypothetical protein
MNKPEPHYRSTTAEGKGEWEPVPVPIIDPVGPLSLRAPAGEAWRRDAVVWVTLAAELLGALVVGWALLRFGTGGTGAGPPGGGGCSGPVGRRRSARLRGEKQQSK